MNIRNSVCRGWIDISAAVVLGFPEVIVSKRRRCLEELIRYRATTETCVDSDPSDDSVSRA